MSQIDTLRPVSVRYAGGGTAVPSGNLATVTADNNDATYIEFPMESTDNTWSLRMEPHLAPAGFGRHQVRGRIRIRTDVGTMAEDIDVGRGNAPYITYGTVTATASMTEQVTGWTSESEFNLGSAEQISDFNIGGGWPGDPTDGATLIRTAEAYLDIDCRQRPQYTAEIRDSAGVNQAGGVVTDTNQPDLWFGTPAYDGLNARSWSAQISYDGTTILTFSGAGTPPTSIPVGVGLDDGAYVATFKVSSTIRASDEFPHFQTINFSVQNTVPPPSPPNLSVEREGDGYRLSWEFPGGQIWDDDYVVAEVWRDDCTGSQRIATVPNGLSGSYLDLAVPQADTEHVLDAGQCVLTEHGCDITYRVRYWGYVSTTVEIPDSIPVDLVIGWPGSIASIPSGWLRVTELDNFYPRGATGTGAPVATGGAASHSHTTPSHTHSIPSHRHGMPNETDFSSTSTNTERREGASISIANQSHRHALPAVTGYSPAVSSGSAAPGTSSAFNEPPTRTVIWIRSDGSALTYPLSSVAWSMENVSGWVADTASKGRFLRGAPAGIDGNQSYGNATHTHTVLSHTHAAGSHDHPNFTTELSGPPASTEATSGSGTPRWLGRHNHPGNVVAGTTGTVPAATGGTTSAATTEPPHRRLRVLRNTGGGAQTRIIGLYTGALADLDPVLTVCNGSNGTPDMRGLFARDIDTGSVGITAGTSTHTHTTPNHGHPPTVHLHSMQIGESNSRDYGRDTTGTQGQVPVATHTHEVDTTDVSNNLPGQGGAGTTGSTSHLPVYREVHFVRVDGTVAGGDLPVPELKLSEFASITAPALLHTDGMDRIGSLTAVMAVTATRSGAFPRLVTDEVQVTGGIPTVSTTIPGEDLSLVIAVEGKSSIDQLEEILSVDRVYWAPLGGTPGWFAPGGWSVAGPAPDVKVVSVSLVRQPWPATETPEAYL